MFFYNESFFKTMLGAVMVNLYTRRTLSATCIAFICLLCAPAWAAQEVDAADVVGEVTTVIGLGKIHNTLGEQSIARGQRIRAGDKIETAAGGHVHVRFVDGGLVSIRPLSRLHIEDYRNRDTQNQAAIKFRLDVGVVRSVTGQWGESNRDRFRLNTPVAAIGIKGTDFVVKAENASTLVSVKTGAIVMAPLEGSCAVALGPCAGERSVQLTSEMSGKMLEYLKQNDKSGPRLIPYIDLLARSAPATQVADVRHSELLSTAEVTAKTIDNQLKDAVVADESPASKPLVWLHNALGWNVPDNSISARFDEASAVGRRPVVGNFFISLYRDETLKKDFTPPSAITSFNLLSASANYTAIGLNAEPATVSDAKLTVDFAKSALTTQMNLASPSMGPQNFTATAAINAQGLFVGNSSGQQLAGAFSTDARQAGYLFEKTVSGGTVSGLTLWGR
jgi:hypothetical protein